MSPKIVQAYCPEKDCRPQCIMESLAIFLSWDGAGSLGDARWQELAGQNSREERAPQREISRDHADLAIIPIPISQSGKPHSSSGSVRIHRVVLP